MEWRIVKFASTDVGVPLSLIFVLDPKHLSLNKMHVSKCGGLDAEGKEENIQQGPCATKSDMRSSDKDSLCERVSGTLIIILPSICCHTFLNVPFKIISLIDKRNMTGRDLCNATIEPGQSISSSKFH